MKDQYTISEFFLLLKLGIFRSGVVGNWGYISLSNTNQCFLKRPITSYQDQPYAIKQLGIGLYLLDCYMIEDYNKIQGSHIMVISVCRTTLDYKEKVYILKLASNNNVTKTREAILGSINIEQRRKLRAIRISRDGVFNISSMRSAPRRHKKNIRN